MEKDFARKRYQLANGYNYGNGERHVQKKDLFSSIRAFNEK